MFILGLKIRKVDLVGLGSVRHMDNQSTILLLVFVKGWLQEHGCGRKKLVQHHLQIAKYGPQIRMRL